jgi:hypothetical protein
MSKTVAARLTETEHAAFLDICRKYNITRQQLFRAMIIDALVDEGYDGLRPEQSERCEGGSAPSETSRPAATGDNYWNYVRRPRPKVDV